MVLGARKEKYSRGGGGIGWILVLGVGHRGEGEMMVGTVEAHRGSKRHCTLSYLAKLRHYKSVPSAEMDGHQKELEGYAALTLWRLLHDGAFSSCSQLIASRATKSRELHSERFVHPGAWESSP